MQEREITWLRGEHCQEGDACQGVARLSGEPGLYVVAHAVTDPVVLETFAHRIGDSEVLVSVTDELFPELGRLC